MRNAVWYVTFANDHGTSGPISVSVMAGPQLDPPFPSDSTPGGHGWGRLANRATEEGLKISAIIPFNAPGWMVFLHD